MDLAGVDLARTERYGAPGGPLVIALHGAVANRKTWLPLARALSPDYELWCPDLPGHGARRDESFTLEASLRLVEALVAHAAPRRPVLAGDSLGGYVALGAGARLGERIAGIAAGGCTWSMLGAGGVLARLTDVPPALLERALGTARCERLAEALVPRVVDAPTAAAIVDAGLRLASRPESLRELARFDLVAAVRAVRVPVALVNGRFDWPTRAGEGELLRAARDATLTIAARSGHGVGIFAPEVFAGAIESLVARSRN